MRERGLAVNGGELIFAQAYLQAVLRPALAAMNAYDAILTPTLASPPVPVGYFTEVDPAANFERQKRFTPFTAAYNLSGQPAVNLPLYWNAGRAADRRHAGRPDRRRGHPDLPVRPARTSPPLGSTGSRRLI